MSEHMSLSSTNPNRQDTPLLRRLGAGVAGVTLLIAGCGEQPTREARDVTVATAEALAQSEQSQAAEAPVDTAAGDPTQERTPLGPDALPVDHEAMRQTMDQMGQVIIDNHTELLDEYGQPVDEIADGQLTFALLEVSDGKWLFVQMKQDGEQLSIYELGLKDQTRKSYLIELGEGGGTTVNAYDADGQRNDVSAHEAVSVLGETLNEWQAAQEQAGE